MQILSGLLSLGPSRIWRLLLWNLGFISEDILSAVF